MSRIPLSRFTHYVLGLFGIVLGAGLTSATESMLPLAMGSALAALCTVGLVREIRERTAARQRARTMR